MLLSVGATLVMLASAACLWDEQVWFAIAILFPVTIMGIWTVCFAIGCLVMIPVAIWRLSTQVARHRAGKVTPLGQLWDEWIDRPWPSRS
jgi:hypothetical protein